MEAVGAFIKKRREQKGLTRDALAKRTSCTSKTIQRAETGEVKTYLQTIYPILSILDISHDEFDGMCYGLDTRAFYSDVERIWDTGRTKNYGAMPKMIEKLKADYGELDRPTLKQAILLLEGAVLCNKDNNYPASLAIMYEALKLTTTDIVSGTNAINCRKVAENIFSLYEHRIIRFIANTYTRMGEPKKSLEIYKAIVSSIENDTRDYGLQKKLLPITYFNLSNELIANDNYEEGLITTESGLESCRKNKDYKLYGKLLCNKGRAFHGLGNAEQTRKIFQQSYNTLVTLEEFEDAKHLQVIAKDEYNIIIEQL